MGTPRHVHGHVLVLFIARQVFVGCPSSGGVVHTFCTYYFRTPLNPQPNKLREERALFQNRKAREKIRPKSSVTSVTSHYDCCISLSHCCIERR